MTTEPPASLAAEHSVAWRVKGVLESATPIGVVDDPTLLAFYMAAGGHGKRFYVPDPRAPVGSVEHRLASYIGGSGEVIAQLRDMAARHRRLVSQVPYHPETNYSFIGLTDDCTGWEVAQGRLCSYVQGDEALNLRDMIANTSVAPLGLNRTGGELQDVIGFLVNPVGTGLAYSGRSGDPFKLVVPVLPGQEDEVLVVVRCQAGRTVYGLQVEHRLRGPKMVRRVVSYADDRICQYLVLASGDVLFIPEDLL